MRRGVRGLSRSVLALAVGAGVLAGCSAPGEPADDGVVLADPYEDDTLNPLMGFAEDGMSKIFDGLVTHDARRRVRPALAAEVPQPSADGLTWSVRLRTGVTFHDGSAFGPEDVVATYRTLLDPAAASPLASSYRMLAQVRQTGPDTVEFRLRHRYAPFVRKLVLGIVPSERLTGGPLESSPLNTRPVGTGPYRLAEWRRGERLVLTAHERHWDGAPAIKRVTVLFVPDDNTRAQRMRRGDFDGTVLPPALAGTFARRDGMTVHGHDSADYRGVMLPQKHPVTGDLAIRRALNLAADREGMIKALLAGRGTPAHTPLPPALGEYADPGAVFRFDPDEAGRILDAGGWRAGPDGIRVKDGRQARFTLMYPADDSVRKALANAFASDAGRVGIKVDLAGLGWDAIEPRMDRDALLMGGGTPLDPDLVAYGLLHSSQAEDGFNNPGSYRDEIVDDALERGRTSLVPSERADAYRTMQRRLVENPPWVFLVFLEHTYVVRDGWSGYQPVVDPHVHGVLTWGPWWNLEKWRR
ncbi:ABC transporter substrate-binding protein [Thermomonospora cellulosilytica]|uniref:Peptide/nickel transport system substrate-binding protein n=1 Tax=Thermomonospora cellulosilytica TaxID=1411118 RepID=A0A7W3R6K8_9ACTN|nr:ABC transporter substrate-binding protein [Thermomonospora cellulosilytica]MBA9001559.1 peptide/nickel transport system substrate-binding protein [Thermomonospora cellulosilytica]